MNCALKTDGAVILRNCLSDTDLAGIDSTLAKEWKAFAVDSPYTDSCAEFAKKNPKIVSEIYDRVANLPEAIYLAKSEPVKNFVLNSLGQEAKIYTKVPLRIDVPLETKELAVWHQDDFYVQGAPNEIIAWIQLQDTPMQMGALSVMKGSHLKGKLDHNIQWGKKFMPAGQYDLPIQIVEMTRGDILFFDSFLLHTSNINFSKYIRYSLQIRFTSKQLGKPSSMMGELNEF